MTLAEFFHMGGYAFHVWTAYGVTLVLMVAHIVVARRKRKQIKRQISKALRRKSQA